MNLYAALPFISGLSFLSFGLFVYLRNPSSKLNLFYFLTCLSTTIWIISYSFMYASYDESKALFLARIGYAGVVFIPTFLYNFTITFLSLNRKKSTIFSIYLISIFFLLANTTKYFMLGMHRYFWGFYPRAGSLYILFVIFFSAVFIRSAWLLFGHIRKKEL